MAYKIYYFKILSTTTSPPNFSFNIGSFESKHSTEDIKLPILKEHKTNLTTIKEETTPLQSQARSNSFHSPGTTPTSTTTPDHPPDKNYCLQINYPISNVTLSHTNYPPSSHFDIL